MCEVFGIADGHRLFFKSEIEKIVRGIATWIVEDRSTPSRNADLDRLNSMNSQLKDVVQRIGKMGPKGALALRAITDFVAPLVSARWVSNKFPGDDWAPAKSLVSQNILAGRVPRMLGSIAGNYFIDELSLEGRYRFVRFRSKETLLTILQEVEQGIEAALSVIRTDPESRGGAPLTYRRYMLADLARLWRSIGKETPTSPQSEFARFCEYVCECVGWPSHGVGSAIPQALELLTDFRET
jgi:hypothetical protein